MCGMIRRKPMNKVGIRTKRRREMNVKLKKIWLEQNITSCELRLPGCMGTWAMGAAHAKKSRFLQSDPDWLQAVLACVCCHQKAESMSHEDMFNLIVGTIEKRGLTE